MEKKDYSKMSNSEIKAAIMVLEHQFESEKAEVKKICEKMNETEAEYERAKNELEIRKTVY